MHGDFRIKLLSQCCYPFTDNITLVICINIDDPFLYQISESYLEQVFGIAIEPDAQKLCMAAMLSAHSTIKIINKGCLFSKIHYDTSLQDPELRGPGVGPTLQVRDSAIFL